MLIMRSYHVAIAAEAIAAAQFARAGCDVSVQYGANQPEYDLMVGRNGKIRKVSVKGSTDGGWVLVASHKKSHLSYHEAIDVWLNRHTDQSVLYCLVQFFGVRFNEMPRVYLATSPEVAHYLKASRRGFGYTSVREAYTWSRGQAAGAHDGIPSHWTMTNDRISELLGDADIEP
jgi:hypothetical protein